MYRLTIDTADKPLYKIIYADGSSSDYQNPYIHDFNVIDVNNINELYDLLLYLAPLTHNCIVRGLPVGGDHVTDKRRTYKEDLHDDPGLKDVDQNWIMIDIDNKIPLPGGITEEEIPEYIIYSVMPEYLHEVDYIFQFSSKAGIEHWTKGHFWFLLDKPYVNLELKKGWALINDWCDVALYQPSQPHYTAVPHFEGYEDPVKNRTQLHIKDHRVATLTMPTPAEIDTKEQMLISEKIKDIPEIAGGFKGAAKWRNYFNFVTAGSAHHYHFKSFSSFYGLFGGNADWNYFAEYQLKIYQSVGHRRGNQKAVLAEIKDSMKDIKGMATIGLEMSADEYWAKDNLSSDALLKAQIQQRREMNKKQYKLKK